MSDIQVIKIASKRCMCVKCGAEETIRFFVAAKLPEPLCLCDKHYIKIRDALEQALRDLIDRVLNVRDP